MSDRRYVKRERAGRRIERRQTGRCEKGGRKDDSGTSTVEEEKSLNHPSWDCTCSVQSGIGDGNNTAHSDLMSRVDAIFDKWKE